MNSISRWLLCSCSVTLLVLGTFGVGWAGEKRVGILISREIAPYVSMVQGLESQLNTPVQRFFLDTEGKPYSLGGFSATLESKNYDVLVAVGPEALQYLNSVLSDRPLVHSMVLNPDKIITPHPQHLSCGVSLNLAPEVQFSSILRYLPTLKRLGVLFDPKNNQAWFEAAAAIAATKGFELVPLQARSHGARLDMENDFTGLDAVMFIPDKSIISKAVIQHVIKQGILHKIPVIGYNQFFYDSGAAISFLIEYEKVGHQVAKLVDQLLAGEKCTVTLSPDYGVVVNDGVWRVLR